MISILCFKGNLQFHLGKVVQSVVKTARYHVTSRSDFWQMIDNTDCERQALIPNVAIGT